MIPLLKKETLHVDELKNYRSVSNISFISKLIEKVAIRKLVDHLSDNGLEEYQSAYKAKDSMETTLFLTR